MGLLLGCVTLLAYGLPLLIAVAMLVGLPALWLAVRRGSKETIQNIAVGLAVLCGAYWAIWNTNYLALYVIGDRSLDPAIREIDRWFYRWLLAFS